MLTVATGDAVQLQALRAQAESFARWIRGDSCEGATIDDAVAALQAAESARAATTRAGLAIARLDG